MGESQRLQLVEGGAVDVRGAESLTGVSRSGLYQLLAQGLPEEARAWLGMLGFRVIIDVHGNVLRVEQPSAPEEPPE
jgi:hypothetical protein